MKKAEKIVLKLSTFKFENPVYSSTYSFKLMNIWLTPEESIASAFISTQNSDFSPMPFSSKK